MLVRPFLSDATRKSIDVVADHSSLLGKLPAASLPTMGRVALEQAAVREKYRCVDVDAHADGTETGESGEGGSVLATPEMSGGAADGSTIERSPVGDGWRGTGRKVDRSAATATAGPVDVHVRSRAATVSAETQHMQRRRSSVWEWPAHAVKEVERLAKGGLLKGGLALAQRSTVKEIRLSYPRGADTSKGNSSKSDASNSVAPAAREGGGSERAVGGNSAMALSDTVTSSTRLQTGPRLPYVELPTKEAPPLVPGEWTNGAMTRIFDEARELSVVSLGTCPLHRSTIAHLPWRGGK